MKEGKKEEDLATISDKLMHHYFLWKMNLFHQSKHKSYYTSCLSTAPGVFNSMYLLGS